MGNRKRNSALLRKETKKQLVFATLRDYPVSPKKAMLVADLVRNMEVNKALAILKQLNKAMAPAFYHLIKSALANYNVKKQETNVILYINVIRVTQGMVLKRIQPAPQGRAHRILKRYSHIYVSISENTRVSSAAEQFEETL